MEQSKPFMQDLNHKHIMVYATVKNPPTDTDLMKDWFIRLVEAVDMKVVIPPQVVNLRTPGNEGITGVVTIETSHSSIHVWECAPVAFLNFDLYSCKDFDPQTILKLISVFLLLLLRIPGCWRSGLCAHQRLGT